MSEINPCILLKGKDAIKFNEYLSQETQVFSTESLELIKEAREMIK